MRAGSVPVPDKSVTDGLLYPVVLSWRLSATFVLLSISDRCERPERAEMPTVHPAGRLSDSISAGAPVWNQKWVLEALVVLLPWPPSFLDNGEDFLLWCPLEAK